MKEAQPAVNALLSASNTCAPNGSVADSSFTTSLSLAQALAVGVLARLDVNLKAVNIWDPTCGIGFAGALLSETLHASGVRVCYRGQDISSEAVQASRHRFESFKDAEVAHGDTLISDKFTGFVADLVIVDAPWGLNWQIVSDAVRGLHDAGSFSFGLPQTADSTWLFISLALEKLRPASEGGGRVAALVNPSALSSGGASAEVRRRILDAGLLESVTRLPDGLAPNTSIPLYLLTFSNDTKSVRNQSTMIADLQALFVTDGRLRLIPASALRELESGLRRRKQGPRNRFVAGKSFIRRDAWLSRVAKSGERISWKTVTYGDTELDQQYLASSYGSDFDVSVDEEPRKVVDLNPSRLFSLARTAGAMTIGNGWPSRRLTGLLESAPVSDRTSQTLEPGNAIFVPTARSARVSTEAESVGERVRVLALNIDADVVRPEFLAAWLNSEEGVASRDEAIERSSSGTFIKALRSEPNAFMRWADELIVPVPDLKTQRLLASADERLGAFQMELANSRSSIWTAPDSADEVVERMAAAFDDSLSAWLEQLPFPIASALWAAETADSLVAQQKAYLHAWEAIATFHATALLSACRSDPGGSAKIETAIRKTLNTHQLGIERASFGTWSIIIEKTSKELRSLLSNGDADDLARVRRSFAGLSRSGIERLVSTELVIKLNEVSTKRNKWLGHSGYTPDEELRSQVDSLISDLIDLRALLGNVWNQLRLVRAGSARLDRAGVIQKAELAVGTRSPFASQDLRVGEMMMDGELYLAQDGSESPLALTHFVQLREAPFTARFTSYFYNRTEGASVRLISYQHGSESEVKDSTDSLALAFGGLTGPDEPGSPS
ncbi:HsdM family class I SAM-dependent methyltransferase [Mycetocola saprophilus]|uniref:HsdM family class I SAM-dependent methyltransferase n=1 Tax=Mycetocola saprophilus TaxID=76636 RepID=UPI003BF16DB2